jgi:TRAP-type uncharacterized transport system fused permease subunit
MYMTLEGIFGVADRMSRRRSSSCSPIYGAFLQYSGRGQILHTTFRLRSDGRQATRRRAHHSAGRPFLLGGPSGSGVATTVTLGTVAYPMLVKAVDTGKNAAGGRLAAGRSRRHHFPAGSGAAAFLIAQFLNISYLDVHPDGGNTALLYYTSRFF